MLPYLHNGEKKNTGKSEIKEVNLSLTTVEIVKGKLYCSKMCLIYCLFTSKKYCWMSSKECRPWVTPFAQTCLSKYCVVTVSPIDVSNIAVRV